MIPSFTISCYHPESGEKLLSFFVKEQIFNEIKNYWQECYEPHHDVLEINECVSKLLAEKHRIFLDLNKGRFFLEVLAASSSAQEKKLKIVVKSSAEIKVRQNA